MTQHDEIHESDGLKVLVWAFVAGVAVWAFALYGALALIDSYLSSGCWL